MMSSPDKSRNPSRSSRGNSTALQDRHRVKKENDVASPGTSKIRKKKSVGGSGSKGKGKQQTTPSGSTGKGKRQTIPKMFAMKRSSSPVQSKDITFKKVKQDSLQSDIEENNQQHKNNSEDVNEEASTNSKPAYDLQVSVIIESCEESIVIDNGTSKNDYNEQGMEQNASSERIDEPEPDIGSKDNDKLKRKADNMESITSETKQPLYYQGHPQNAVEEVIALTNDKLVLSTGDEGDGMDKPQTNITGFSIFDKQGQLTPIDGGLIEKDIKLYMSGYLKSICSDSPEIDEESIPVKDVGPILEWSIYGFDGGKKNYISLSTKLGEYNLLDPSKEYTSLMNSLYEKMWLSKVVVEYLDEYHSLRPTYENLLEVIREATIPELENQKMTEEILHKHAQFVCDQVASLVAGKFDDPLITFPCMRQLIKLLGVKFGKRKVRTKTDSKKVDKKARWTKATTTPLVRKTFESFFTNELDYTNHGLQQRVKRCGICEICQRQDCGKCSNCRGMAKFGGHGTKEACLYRLCPKLVVQQVDDSDPEEEGQEEELLPIKYNESYFRNIKWVGEPIKVDAKQTFYARVEIDGIELQIGDYVMVETLDPKIPALITKVVYMWKENLNPKRGYFHGEVFMRSSDTVLGQVGNPREVFLCNRCSFYIPFSSVLRKAYVDIKKDTPEDWFQLGGKEYASETIEDDGKTYFCNKFYERFTARFENLPEDPVCRNEFRKHKFCPSCDRKIRGDLNLIPRVVGNKAVQSTLVIEADRTEWPAVRWQGYDYKKGCGVFLKPRTIKFRKFFNTSSSSKKNISTCSIKRSSKKRSPKKRSPKKKQVKVDENIYPEYYRKSDFKVCRPGKPFCVGFIAAVTAKGEGPLIAPQDIFIKVNVLYRPENIVRFPQRKDLNVVYWSDRIIEVPFSSVVGPCHLIYIENIPQQDGIDKWLERDPSRFYFKRAFNDASRKFVKVPHHATKVGRMDKGKGKGKGKSSKPQEPKVAKFEDNKIRPLRTLDVFAGCGGLSDGLHQAGVAECKWAIENVEPAAHAYSLNNESCTVFHEDCNALLKDAMSGATHSAAGLPLPMQGEVELLCGGPPCQGFSGMNRFNSRQYSNFKNSLVASYLSFCDYYRPKYFMLENVRNFVAFKKGMVLKLTLGALLAMGYQCTFAILQAGSYGVPQTRRRLIIMAAAPGYKLPLFPEPTHVFSRRACFLTATIDRKKIYSNIDWKHCAPRRACTIHDAMSDLPEICNGANETEIEYELMPETHFQRTMRSKDETAKLHDHICKMMAPLIHERICRVPTQPGSDWRDLPNISVTLSDGTKCKVLQYLYDDKKNGRSQSGALRGVCACAAGGACSPRVKQDNTLIPWCLPHTGNRHNHWAGLYGRLSWDGFFRTTVTDPEPMGKQGRVLHPSQNRVVSVRECARSQGFRDTFLFSGSLQDKHRQIGNAVPPPLAAAVGREIIKALAASDLYR